MYDRRKTFIPSFLFTLFLILSLALIGACGGDEKLTGDPASLKSGASELPPSAGYASLPSGNFDDLNSPDTKAKLDGLIGKDNADKLVKALENLTNPSSPQSLSQELGRALQFMQMLVQRSDALAKQQFALFLQILSIEMESLKKDLSKSNQKKKGGKFSSLLSGIGKGAANRSKGSTSGGTSSSSQLSSNLMSQLMQQSGYMPPVPVGSTVPGPSSSPTPLFGF